MKHKLKQIVISTTITFLIGVSVASAAFPDTFTSWVSGNVITSQWLNVVERALNVAGGKINGGVIFSNATSTATSSLNFTITTSTAIANNLFNVIGTVSSTEQRSPSSTIGTLTVTTCLGCPGGGFTNGFDGQMLIGLLGGNGTSTNLLSVVSSTGIITISGTSSITGIASTTANFTLGGANTQVLNQLTFANASGTNQYLAGYLRVAGTLTDFNGNKYSTSTAGGSNPTGVTTSTPTFANGVPFFIGGNASSVITTLLGLSVNSSTGQFISGSSSLTNVSSTNVNVGGYLQVAGGLFDFNGNKYSTSTGGGGATGVTTGTPIFANAVSFFIGGNASSVIATISSITVNSSTGQFISSSSSLANVSSTNGNFSGSLQVAGSLVDFNGNKFSTSTGGGGGAGGVTTSTPIFENAVPFFVSSNASSVITTLAGLTVNSSTGQFVSGSSSLTNVSSTNFTAGTIQVTGQSTLANVSSTNINTSGYITAAGAIIGGTTLNVVSGRTDLQIVSMSGLTTVNNQLAVTGSANVGLNVTGANNQNTIGGLMLFNGTQFAVASAGTSTALALFKGTGVASTTLLLQGATNQTADLLDLASSTGQLLFSINPMGLASSSQFRSPSSTIGTLTAVISILDFNGNKYVTSTAGGSDTFLSAGVDGQLLFGKVGGGATSSVLFTVVTSTATFTINASSSIFLGGGLVVGTSTLGQGFTLELVGQSQGPGNGQRPSFALVPATTTGPSGGVNTEMSMYRTRDTATNFSMLDFMSYGTGTPAFRIVNHYGGTGASGTISLGYFQGSGTNYNDVFNITTSSYIGVNTVYPSSTFEILGTTNQTDDIFQVASSTGQRYFTINSVGTASSSGAYLASTTITTFYGGVAGTGPQLIIGAASGPLYINGQSNNFTEEIFGTSGANFLTVENTSGNIISLAKNTSVTRALGTPLMSFNVVNNNIGIQDTNPSFALEVNGTVSSTALYTTSSTINGLFVPNFIGVGQNATNSALAFFVSNAASTTLLIQATTSQSADLLDMISNPGLLLFGVNSNGQIALGTSTIPASSTLLHIATSSNLFRVDNTGVSQFGTSTSQLTINTSNPSPNKLFDVQTSSSLSMFSISSSGLAFFGLPYSTSTAGIGGSSLTAGTCASSSQSVPYMSTSTNIIVTPQQQPGPDIYYKAFITGVGVATSTVETDVCAAGITATPLKVNYNLLFLGGGF